MWLRWLTDALSGKTSLARAFWVYGLGVTVAYSLLAGLLDLQDRLSITVYLLFGVALGVLQSAILWRCAYNSQFAFLGRLLRAALVLGLIMAAVMLYVFFTNADVLLPPNNRWSGP